jgi:microtubule-associated protein, RP/EB family
MISLSRHTAGTSKLATVAPTSSASKVPTITSPNTKSSTLAASASSAAKKVAVSNSTTGSTSRRSKPPSPNGKSSGAVGTSHQSQIDSEELAKLQVTLETMQKERDFYFGKLREIEILCQQDENIDANTPIAVLKKQLLDILYHSDGDGMYKSLDRIK